MSHHVSHIWRHFHTWHREPLTKTSHWRRWHSHCDFIRKENGARNKLEGRYLYNEKKKTNFNRDDSFKQRRPRSKLTLRSRCSGKWAATATNATHHTEPTSTAN